jgi:glycosyltransferase involved in cell wall biosynthesis
MIRPTRTNPSVTIAVTSYNYEAFVGQAIESALAQGYPNLEVLVLDNASTDGSRQVIERFRSHPRVRLLFHEQNIGRNGNYNRAWQESRSDYVVYLSADDFLLPGHIETLVGLLARYPKADLTYARVIEVDAAGRPMRENQLAGLVAVDSHGPGRNSLGDLLACSSFMWLPTMLFPRALLEESGGFDDSIEVAADFDLQVRLAARGSEFAFVNRALAAIRFHGANPSGGSFAASGDLVREYLRTYERILVPSPPPAIRERQHAIVAKLREYVVNVDVSRRPSVAEDCGPAIERVTDALQASFDVPFEKEPLVSIIVPTAGKRLGALCDALESIAAQSYSRWEAIVVDDGAVDLSALFDWIREDSRFRFVRNARPVGPGPARNAGIRLSRGTVLAYLDDDDIFLAEHVATLVDAITAGADVAVASAILAVDTEGARGSARRETTLREPLQYPADAWRTGLAASPCIPLSAVAHRRSVVDRCGPFIAGLPVYEAWEFLARIAQQTAARFTLRETVEMHWAAGLRMQELGRFYGQLPAFAQIVYDRVPTSAAVTVERNEYRSCLQSTGTRLATASTMFESTRSLAQFATRKAG